MPVPVDIDEQEIKRTTPTYTIETLRLIRAELGDEVSLIWLLGADQLQHLDTWQEWQHIFDYAHLCVAPRPGFAIDDAHVPATVAQEFARRAASVAQLRDTPHGLTYLATNLAVDISATEIRAALHDGQRTSALMPPAVLDYIQQHHLYKS
jgi:nicotinate-nucleotide adenylyltransferase